MSLRLVLSLAIGLTTISPLLAEEGKSSLDPNMSYGGTKSSPVTYQVDLSAVVTAPYKTKILRVWMPLPPSNEHQVVQDRKMSTFPMKVEPRIGKEKLHDNEFAYFEFHQPQGGQIIRHQFQITCWEVNWNADIKKVTPIVGNWPASFGPYLRSERLVPTDDRFRTLALQIVPTKTNPMGDLAAIMHWANLNLTYDHAECSLQGNAIHALEKRKGHCSDYHGLCTALGRSLGYPTRIVYGINPYPKNSPSHCKLEAFIPPHGWVCFDVSETQQLIQRIKKDDSLDAGRKEKLIDLAQKRLEGGFRDNTWFLQTRGSDYDLEPPASRKVAVVRTIYAEADGEPLPEPDPGSATQRSFSWMTVHNYTSNRAVASPFQDWKSLER
jgi:transglutaminase-like putative cysteine protease